jgi:hypothetical protein
MPKPIINIPFRISTDECGDARFTEQEIKDLIKSGNCHLHPTRPIPTPGAVPLLIRTSDGKVVGEFFYKDKVKETINGFDSSKIVNRLRSVKTDITRYQNLKDEYKLTDKMYLPSALIEIESLMEDLETQI